MRESQTRTKKKSEESDNQETLKAAAWAVFQHRNGGGSSTNRHHGAVPVQQATRFKIEAQMKRELERHSVSKANVLPSWYAGSALFDAYELDTVFKHLDLAFQSVDTQQKDSLDRSEHTEESISEPALTYSSRQSQYTDPHVKYPQHYSRQEYATAEEDTAEQRNWLDTVDESHRIRANYLDTVDETLTHGYATAVEYTSDQLNWLDTVDESLRVRAIYLETVDETLPFAQEQTGYGYDENKVNICEDSNLKPVTSMHMYADNSKDGQEAEPQEKFFKPMQFSHTPSRWNVLQGRRCSFDTSPLPIYNKDIKQSRKWKLQNIFKSKAAKDGITPKPSRQAQIVPDDLSQKGRKGKTQNPLRKSGEIEYKKFSTGPQDSDSSDNAKGAGYDVSQEYASVTKRAYQDQIPLPHDGKSGLHKVLVPTFSRTVRLSSDMSNPDADEGLLNHLRHGALTYGAPDPLSVRRKGSYSLNVSPVQQPRKSMLQGARDDFDLDSEVQYHHEYHHHYHHHHHHIGHGQDDDYELTVQDIVKRVPRKSFEEEAHRLSIEENTGLKAPRNSLETSCYKHPTSKLFL